MPQQIDWSGIRANAIILGVREAARRAAINLSDTEANRFVQRVLKRSARQGWITQKQEAASQPSISEQSKPMSANVLNGAELAKTQLKEHGDSTKLNLAKVAKTASEVLLKKKGNALLKQHQAFKNFVSGSGQLHGWDTASSGGSINLNILTNQAAVQVNTGSK